VTTSRQFCRFTRGNAPHSIHEIPEHGFCLSTFLILYPRGRPDRVLVGRMDPSAPWDRLGGLGPDRVEAHRHGWLLPASQLILGESPDESAHRILREMLTGLQVELRPPLVDSEVYAARRFPEATQHWDLRFVYRGEAPDETLPARGPWTELRWLDLRTARAENFARSHEDVLLRLGLSLRDA
jgi:ADP-ribose pyrophosphatase YjhB (NUDIX family)